MLMYSPRQLIEKGQRYVSNRAPVKFDRPPVVEVACGVSFTLPKPLRTAHIGLYWSRVSGEFPRCDDAQPIAHIVESNVVADSAEIDFRIEHVSLPPMRRAWLINEAGTHLLQLQEDRFLFNWKRVADNSSYPSYQEVVAGFRTQWANYKSFLSDQKLGDPSITQLEMTYFNFLVTPADELRDHVRDRAADRFLPQPETVWMRNSYPLPDGVGRLHVVAQTGRQVGSGTRGLRLELTARGLPKDLSREGCETWFDTAHEWITHGFADVTTREAHHIWGRTS